MSLISRIAKTFHAVLGAAIIWALPAHAGGISESALRDIRIEVVFEAGSGYENNPQAQAEFVRGAELAMHMWESVFPTMRVYFVTLHDKFSANLTFFVGNYAGQDRQGCGKGGGAPGGSWDGCSFFPDANGNIAGGRIYFNSRGYVRYFHDRFVYFSRDKLYNSYEPATYPPVGYGDPGLADGKGWIDGRFKDEAGGIGVNWLVFHEFGHSVGLAHAGGSPLGFYGIPHPQGVPSGPAANEITPDRTTYPLLPAKYFGGGTPSAPWVPDIRPLTMNLSHMLSIDDHPAGLPNPSTGQFNYHVVGPDDISQLLNTIPSSRVDYPVTRGLIRLQKYGSGAPVSLTSSWKQAITSAQLDRTGAQSDPFYVTGVFKGDQIQKVAAGAFHTLAIRDDGTLWAWGANDKGQLGNGTLNNSYSPISIGSSLLGSGRTWVSVSAGENFSLALRSDNALFAWGNRSNGQVGDGVIGGSPATTPKQVAGSWAAVKAGPLHALALKSDGTLWGWGYNGTGQLGIGNNSDQASPKQEYFMYTDWISLSAGSLHSTGMRVGGTVWSWGWNDYGTLGNGNNTGTNYPVQESYYSPYWVTSEAGHEHSVTMSTIGDVFVWGRNQFAQLGTASANPSSNIPLYFGNGYVSIAAGHWHNAAIKRDGSLWSWGFNSRGQLGGNVPAGETRTVPVREATVSKQWVEVYPGKEQTLAMRTDGTLYGWGNNTNGQLGTGSASSTPVLTPVRTKFGAKPSLTLMMGETPTETPTVPNQTPNLREKTGSRPSVYLLAETRGNLAKVEFFNGSTLVGTVTAWPYKFTVANLARGQYNFTARLTSNMGEVLTSNAIPVKVHFVDAFAYTNTPATVNLTTEAGSAGDWVQWGHNSTSPWLTRKNRTPLINPNTNVPPVLTRFTVASSGFTWTDGQAGAVSVTNSKTFVGTSNLSWSHEFPASTTKRTVKIYVRVGPGVALWPSFQVGGIWIADFSVIENTGTTALHKVITFDYAAASMSEIPKFEMGTYRANMPNPPAGTGGLQAIVYK